jgi:hypothetical protein
VNHLGLKEIVEDVVRGRVYVEIDNKQVEYDASLIQARGITSNVPLNFCIHTRITHSFI